MITDHYGLDDMDNELINLEMRNTMENITNILRNKDYLVADYYEGGFSLSVELDIYHKSLNFGYIIPYIQLDPNEKIIDFKIPDYLANNWKIIYCYTKLERIWLYCKNIYVDHPIENLDLNFMVIKFNDDELSSSYTDLISSIANKEISTETYRYCKKFLEAEIQLLDWVKSL